MNNTKFGSERILFEDNHLIIVNKNPGELSQGDKTGDHTLADIVKSYIKKKYKKIDILINGAGVNAPTDFFKITEKEFNDIISSHLKGTMFGCQVFGKNMIKNKKGSIINMSSASSGPPLSKAFIYSAAKSGIKNLTQNLAREFAKHKVRVNSLRPGFFPTNWSKRNFIDQKRKKSILSHTPMKRFGTPKELVGAVIWLSSDSSSFVTGAEIPVDGGFTSMTI